MKIALAQLNPTVGDVAGNTQLVIDAIGTARERGADLLVTPEMALLGYPPRDLLFREGVVEEAEAAVGEVARAAGDMTVVVGHPRRCVETVRTIRNSASVCRAGDVLAVYDKRLLPGYDIFDEDRYFDPGKTSCYVDVSDRKVGILICEDLWRAGDVHTDRQYRVDPAAELVEAGCDVIVALNASPFILGKNQRHVELMREQATKLQCPIVVVNQVGANDDLIFEGRSTAVLPDGKASIVLPAWQPAIDVLNLDASASVTMPKVVPQEELFQALVLGVRDYCNKTNHKQVLVGLSGGIDSALTATIATAALGGENVLGITMPSRYSSPGSVEDSRTLATNLGLVRCDEISIEPAHQTLIQSLEQKLSEHISGLPDENLQARLRGVIVMAYSNALGALVLATGNKSELAVGYATLYGDMCGALAVLGDVVKTKVFEVAHWINREYQLCGFACPPIPENTLSKPPSAELRPDQIDQDSLPPYDVLDRIIDHYIDREQSVETIIQETGYETELVERFTRLIDRSEYKREQAAVVLKVSQRSFGRGRSMPIVMR